MTTNMNTPRDTALLSISNYQFVLKFFTVVIFIIAQHQERRMIPCHLLEKSIVN